MRLTALFFLSCLAIKVFALHPVHFSVANIDISPDGQRVTILLRVFSDDLEDAIIHRFEKAVALMNVIADEDLTVLTSYLNLHLSLYANNIKVHVEFSNYRHEDEVIWVTLIGELTSPIKSMTIKNSLITDLYFDQVNLVIVKRGKEEKGLTFNYLNHEATLVF